LKKRARLSIVQSSKKERAMLKQKFQNKLETVLLNHLNIKKSIAKLICQTVESVLRYGTVLHKKLALTYKNDILHESQVRKIERFFSESRLLVNDDFFKTLYSILGLTGKLTVLIDRTNWCFGKKHINILLFAIVWNNSAIPVVWEVLDNKGGGSSAKQRIRLLKKLDLVIGLENIKAVLGDREFIGAEWFQFLYKNNTPFIIRLTHNLYVQSQSGNRVKASTLMEIVKRGKIREIGNFTIGGVPIKLAGTRSVNNELVIVAASANILENPLSDYRKRWLIELFFKSIKTQGFNLEKTHMSNPLRINQLFAIIALASILAIKAGSLRALFKKISVKNHGRRQYSVFSYGLEFLQFIYLQKRCRGAPAVFRQKVVNMLFDQKWNFAVF